MYFINKNSKTPLHIQVYEEIKKEIIHNLKVGDKLQSIRKVATIYNLSKTSVESAYSQLIAEGFIDSYPQKGYFVTDTNYENFKNETKLPIGKEKTKEEFLYDFHPARLEKESFPLKTWKRIFNKAIDESINFSTYRDAQGEYGLRDEIAKYLIESRGVKCTANQIIICNGFGDSMELIIRLLNKTHNTLTIEREKKSIGIGRTFDVIFDRVELKRRVMILCRYLCFLVKKANVNPLTYAILIRYEYKVKSKNYINVNRIFNEMDFKNEMVKLFESTDNHKTHGIIQLNITVSNFAKVNEYTYNLFEYESDTKKRALTNQMQKLRNKYGIDIIKSGFEIKK